MQQSIIKATPHGTQGCQLAFLTWLTIFQPNGNQNRKKIDSDRIEDHIVVGSCHNMIVNHDWECQGPPTYDVIQGCQWKIPALGQNFLPNGNQIGIKIDWYRI